MATIRADQFGLLTGDRGWRDVIQVALPDIFVGMRRRSTWSLDGALIFGSLYLGQALMRAIHWVGERQSAVAKPRDV